ncbi:MAG TPA: SIMPL domain-containing protein [Chthonomonadaceae bacterium]|nr:SIMPL domain-containing protein [Chthonomonadaceae bacterium]
MSPSIYCRVHGSLWARSILGLVALMTLWASALPAQTTSPERRTERPVARRLTVTGQGEVKIQPDKAEITIGVVTEDRSSRTAASANATASRKVQDAVRRSGIAQKDIQTLQYSIQPIYSSEAVRPNGVQRPAVITGYRVSNQVRVTVRDLAGLGEVIDAASAAGSNTIDSIAFGREDPSSAENEALSKAVAAARRKADQLARAAGVRIMGIYEMNEGPIQRPYPMMFGRADVAAAATPINPGEFTVTANVTIVYEMGEMTRASQAALETPAHGSSGLQK